MYHVHDEEHGVTQVEPPMDLPSDITYKDQARPLEDVLRIQCHRESRTSSRSKETVLATPIAAAVFLNLNAQMTSLPTTNVGPAETNGGKVYHVEVNEGKEEKEGCLSRRLFYLLALAIVATAVSVPVSLALTHSDSSEDNSRNVSDSTAVFNQSTEPSPTSEPSTIMQSTRPTTDPALLTITLPPTTVLSTISQPGTTVLTREPTLPPTTAVPPTPIPRLVGTLTDPSGDANTRPDFTLLQVRASDTRVIFEVTYIGETSDFSHFIYMYATHRDVINLSPSTWQLRRDNGADGLFEEELASGIITFRSAEVEMTTAHIEVPRIHLPDLAAKGIWVYSMTSQDRMPDGMERFNLNL